MKKFVKKEPVFVIAGIAALISCFFVLPDPDYLKYIDFRVLGLLFCLMSAVAGIQKSGFFENLSETMLSGAQTTRSVSLVLILLTFFSSMLITNDVALISLVPFAIMVLSKADSKGLIIKTVVLQTVAANLGSMLTPVGNPQNLFIYSYYGLGIGEFFKCILPYATASLVFVIVCTILGKNNKVNFVTESSKSVNRKKLVVYGMLFLLCILTVLNVVNYIITVLVTVAVLVIWDRDILFKTDYFLLMTFVFFFIFSGNLGRMEAVRNIIEAFLQKNTIISSVVTSQVISNVPAAVLLSPFTSDWNSLLIGVNVGGLGTPVASLASLISLKIYMSSENSNPGRYMSSFLVYNLIGLAVLLLISVL